MAELLHFELQTLLMIYDRVLAGAMLLSPLIQKIQIFLFAAPSVSDLCGCKMRPPKLANVNAGNAMQVVDMSVIQKVPLHRASLNPAPREGCRPK